MRYVIDSSVMIKAFVREPDSEKARELVYNAINEENRLIAQETATEVAAKLAVLRRRLVRLDQIVFY